MTLRRQDEEGLAGELIGSSERKKNLEFDSIYNEEHNRTQQPIDNIFENDTLTIIE